MNCSTRRAGRRCSQFAKHFVNVRHDGGRPVCVDHLREVIALCERESIDLCWGLIDHFDEYNQPADLDDEQKPQRFRYRNENEPWKFGVCLPVVSGDFKYWRVEAAGGFSSFDDDPWETLGQVLGGIDVFEWLDHDYGWHGDVAGSQD